MKARMKKIIFTLALVSLTLQSSVHAAQAAPDPEQKLINLLTKRARDGRYEVLALAAAYPASTNVLKKFIEQGADVTDIRGPNDLLVISTALSNPSQDVRSAVLKNLEFLVDNGLRKYAVTRGLGKVREPLEEYAQKRLFNAIIAGDYNTVKKLLEGGLVDTKITIASNRTPLHVAAETGNVHIAELLLEKGADKNARTANDESVLDLVIRYGHDQQLAQFEKMLSE